ARISTAAAASYAGPATVLFLLRPLRRGYLDKKVGLIRRIHNRIARPANDRVVHDVERYIAPGDVLYEHSLRVQQTGGGGNLGSRPRLRVVGRRLLTVDSQTTENWEQESKAHAGDYRQKDHVPGFPSPDFPKG